MHNLTAGEIMWPCHVIYKKPLAYGHGHWLDFTQDIMSTKYNPFQNNRQTYIKIVLFEEKMYDVLSG